MFNFYLKRPVAEDLKYFLLMNKRLFGEERLSELDSGFIFDEIINDEKGILLAVYHGNRMAGYAYVIEVYSLRHGHYAEVIDFYTNEYYRSHGADVYLLRAIEQWTSQTVCHELVFSADDDIKKSLLEKLRYIKDENSNVYRKNL